MLELLPQTWYLVHATGCDGRTQPVRKRKGRWSQWYAHLPREVSTLPFPLLIREGNWKEKGTIFCFGTKDLTTRQVSSLWKANSVFPGLLIVKLGYLHHACGRSFKLSCTGWQQTAKNRKNGDLNFIWLLHTKPGVSTMFVAVVSENYNSFLVWNSGALVQGLCFLLAK